MTKTHTSSAINAGHFDFPLTDECLTFFANRKVLGLRSYLGFDFRIWIIGIYLRFGIWDL